MKKLMASLLAFVFLTISPVLVADPVADVPDTDLTAIINTSNLPVVIEPAAPDRQGTGEIAGYLWNNYDSTEADTAPVQEVAGFGISSEAVPVQIATYVWDCEAMPFACPPEDPD